MENETLDLMGRHSGRWRKLCTKIRNGESIDAIVYECEGCLTGTWKSLHDLLPIRDLLEAGRQGVDAVREIMRHCSKALDYAELFAQQAAICRNPSELVAGVLRATLDRFLDRIGMKVVGSGHWPDMVRFRIEREQISMRLENRIDRLAKQVAENPDKKPSMPRKSAERKEKEHRELLTLSLRSGTLG